MDKIPVVAVVGPTASGKTALAVSLARRYGAEVVSADSMQIYRGMEIATAQPSAEETAGVPHHLIGFLEPTQSYSAAAYCADAHRTIAEIAARGRRVIVCGGTGLYVDSLLSGMVFAPEPDTAEIRRQLLQKKEALGMEALYNELAAVDPAAAAAVHINNEKRVLRALEQYYASGETPSAVRARAAAGESPYRTLYLGLFFEDRSVLYDRIDRRVDAMLAAGLAEEARRFYRAETSVTAAQAIGYKELKPWLAGELSLEQAAENLKRATRRYAKRQLTWFGRNPALRRLYRDRLTDAELFAAAAGAVDASHIFEEENGE